MSKSRCASKSEANKKVQEIRALHELGRKALHLPPGLTIFDQALELGCAAPKLWVARRFASPTKGYSQDQLNDLCDLVLKHRAVFGTSHVEILMAIPWPERGAFQTKCIEKNWSRRELVAAKTKRFKPKSKGGRRPQVTPGDAAVQLKDQANAYCRLFVQMKKPRDQQPSILDGLPGHLRDSVETAFTTMRGLRKAALAHLKTTQKDG